jgi:hypothetical protein
MRTRLTDRFVKSASADGRKSPIFMDDEVIGFGIQVRKTGRKSFTLDYTLDGRRRRLFIGDFPDWSTVAAREQARRSPSAATTPNRSTPRSQPTRRASSRWG